MRNYLWLIWHWAWWFELEKYREGGNVVRVGIYMCIFPMYVYIHMCMMYRISVSGWCVVAKWLENGWPTRSYLWKLTNIFSLPSIDGVLIWSRTKIMRCLGILYVGVLEDEWCVLGTDSNGSHGAAAPNEQRRNSVIHQIVSAWVWWNKCQHRSWSSSSVYPQCCPGKCRRVILQKKCLWLRFWWLQIYEQVTVGGPWQKWFQYLNKKII